MMLKKSDNIDINGIYSTKFQKISFFLLKFFEWLFCIYIFSAIILLTFIYDRKLQLGSWYLNNVQLLFASIFLIIFNAFLLFIINRIKLFNNINEKQFYALIVFIFGVIFGIERFISEHIWFYSGWDVGAVIGGAEMLAFQNISSFADTSLAAYFGTYPNNIVIGHTLAILGKIGYLFFKNEPYKFILIFNNFIVSASALLAALCFYKISRSKSITFVVMLQIAILICFSPWIVIPYTDTFSMPFPVTILFLYLFVKNSHIKYPLICFFGVVGYFYKPTVIIVIIAIAIIELLKYLAHEKNKNVYKYATGLLITSAIVLICTFSLINFFISDEKRSPYNNLEFTYTHFLMMGLNEETTGVYSDNDVNFSYSFDTVEERQHANLAVAKQRLKDFGFQGYLKFISKKTVLNYCDGTFGWGKEGHFYQNIPEKYDYWTGALRNIYYNDNEHFWIYNAIEQILWLSILICLLFCALCKHTPNFSVELICLTLFGVSIFLLLFECRARYLFCFSPLFIILSGIGMQNMYMFCERFFVKKI